MKTLAIVGARLNSSRLPGKHLFSLAGKPLIERLWERLAHSKRLDFSVLATTADNYNQSLVDWANSHSIPVCAYTGDVNDLMGRLNFVVEKYDPEFIVYICGDCPLIEPAFIDHAISSLISSADKDSIVLKSAVKSLHEGMAFYSRQGWEKLYAASQSEMSREHVGYADKLTPVLDKLEIDDSDDFSLVKHRISVDTPADYQFMEEVYQRWYQQHGCDSIVDLKWVQQQLLSDPELSQLNQHVQQKKPEIKYQKVTIFCSANKQVGMGHLRRCAFIANALQEYLGLGTEIVMLGDAVSASWLKTKIVFLKDEETFWQAMSSDRNSLWVLDFHPDFIDMSALSLCCQKVRVKNKTKIIALDKLGKLLPYVDKLYIPGFFTQLSDPKVSAGWGNYFLPSVVLREKRKQILVMTGGSDALGYGNILPSILEGKLPADWPLIWIQGPLAEAPKLSEKSRFLVKRDPGDLAELMAESEVVLSCYGLSLFEAMASHAATLLLPVQHLCSDTELEALEKEGCCMVAHSCDDVLFMLLSLIDDPALRMRLKEKSAKLFVANAGVDNFISLVKNLCS